MKFKFLGTAAAEAVPAFYCNCDICEKSRKLKGKNIRTRSQALINDDLLIDFPADTYLHIIRDGLKLHEIEHILITHNHSDHFYPGDILMRAPGFSNFKKKRPLNVYGSKDIVDVLKKEELVKKMEEPNWLIMHELKEFIPFFVLDYKITPLKADHGSIANPFMYLIEQDGKSVLYAHDTDFFPEETMDYLKEAKPNISFATFDCCYSLMHKDRGHLGFWEVLEMKKRLEEIGVITDKTICVVNHFSHNNGQLYEDMQNHSEKFGILTSYDGMELEF